MLSSLGYTVSLCAWLLGARVRAQTQYRASFVLQLVGQFAATGIDFVGVVLLFQRFPTMDGWTFGEVALLYGMGAIGFAFADLTTGEFERLALQIREGTFDRMLTRPVSAFLQVVTNDLQLRRLGRAVQGMFALAVALALVDIDWSVVKVLMLVAAIVSGVVVFACIMVVGGSLSFWTVQDSEALNVFTYGGCELVSYPMSIYGEWLRRFFTFVIPLAFITYLPALVILDKPDPLGLPRALHSTSPLVALLFLLAAGVVWRLGLRQYQGTGS